MTRREAERVSRYLDRWRERLRLQHYNVTYHYHGAAELPEELSDGRSLAGCTRTWPEIERAEIHLATDAEQPPEYYGRHEVLHLLMAEISDAFGLLKEHVAPAVFRIAERALREAEERVVRRLDEVLEDYDPLMHDEEDHG